MGHVGAVPQGLEDAVGEPEHEDVLDRLLAEVVIDPIHLLLTEGFREQAVQLAGALRVVAERLFDDDARPAVLLARQPGGAEVADDRPVEARRRRAVEEPVARTAVPLLERGQRVVELLTARELRGVGGHVGQGGGEALPHRLGRRLDARELRHRFAHARAELVVGHLRARGADDRERLGQRAARVEAPQGGDELAAGQVARRAEDDQGKRLIRGRHDLLKMDSPRSEASSASTLASRRAWSSACEKRAARNVRASAMAEARMTTAVTRQSTLASSSSRDCRAVKGSWQRAARTPRILLAAIDTPAPLPQIRMPASTR